MSTYGPAELITELDPDYRWDPQSGLTVTRKWKGAKADIIAQEPFMRSRGMQTDVEHDEEGGWSILRATGIPESHGDGELTTVWTLDGNDLEKSIWEHPKISRQLALITDPDKAITLRQMIEAFISGTTVVDDNEEEFKPTQAEILQFASDIGVGFDTFVLSEFLGALARGVEAFTVSQYVLRREIVVPRYTNIRPAYSYVGQLLYTRTMASFENIPDDLGFDLPDGIWLKRTPTRTLVAIDKWQITQEWWHADDYDKFSYGDPQ